MRIMPVIQNQNIHSAFGNVIEDKKALLWANPKSEDFMKVRDFNSTWKTIQKYPPLKKIINRVNGGGGIKGPSDGKGPGDIRIVRRVSQFNPDLFCLEVYKNEELYYSSLGPPSKIHVPEVAKGIAKAIKRALKAKL